MTRTTTTLLALAALAVAAPAPATAQFQNIALRPDASDTKRFGDLAEGPYDRLLIRNVNVLPGHGGPAQGPYDILITGNVIREMNRAGGGEPPAADRVIDGTGMFVMPGMINLHLHLRGDELPLDYIYYLQLATGVTSIGPAEEGRIADQVVPVQNNEILAPRLFPIYGWNAPGFSEEELRDPARAPEIARAIKEEVGARQVYLNSLCWNYELFEAAAQALEAEGIRTGVHIQPASTSVVDALDAARAGVSMIVHHYGYAESVLPRDVQDYPRDYNFNDENKRFREAARVWVEAGQNPETKERLLTVLPDSLVQYDVFMQPNRATYESNRDVVRAQGLPWHEKYTHQALWNWHLPNPHNHASFQYNWTSQDEYYWSYMYDLWGDLIYEFNKRGGTVVFGTDDNYQWSTGGFGNIRELQLMLEAGMHPLEVLRAATQNSARFLMEPKLGLVQEGYVADLLLVDGNPAENFRYLYPFGAIMMDEETEQMYRTRGIVHTIKDGIVIDNDAVMEEVARIVAESKRNARPDIVTEPFLPDPRPRTEPDVSGGAGGR